MQISGGPHQPAFDSSYTTVEEALARLTAIEQFYREANDRRAVFVGAYIAITAAMIQAIEEGRFRDAHWVRSYLVQFSYLYLEALAAFERGALDDVPEAWRVAFELSASGEGLVLQHLLLGVNAHINHDLAFALMRAGIDPERSVRYDDHSAVNEVLKRATDALQDHVERFYSPALYFLDELFGHWDEELSTRVVAGSREKAWEYCLDLVGCSCAEDEAVVRRRIDQHAGSIARLIARPYTSPLDLIEFMRSSP